MILVKRQNTICDDGTNDCNNGYYSSWDNWVRWVVLVAIIVVFLLVFFACSCRSARRRRQAGQQPFYGTRWTARPYHHGQPYYNNNGNNYTPAPPQYSADMPPGHQGYYGQQSGIELQSPPQPYTPGRSTDVYEPPVGPPPSKGTKE